MSKVKKDTKPKEEVKNYKGETIPANKLWVKVYAPFHVYFEGFVQSVSAENDTGPFDVLPGHHKFLTLLSPCDINLRTEEGSKPEKVPIEKGVMFVQSNSVSVFLDV